MIKKDAKGKELLQDLVNEFGDIITDKIGKTNVIKYEIVISLKLPSGRLHGAAPRQYVWTLESNIAKTLIRPSVCEEWGSSTCTKRVVVHTRVAGIAGQGTTMGSPLGNSGQSVSEKLPKAGWHDFSSARVSGMALLDFSPCPEKRFCSRWVSVAFKLEEKCSEFIKKYNDDVSGSLFQEIIHLQKIQLAMFGKNRELVPLELINAIYSNNLQSIFKHVCVTVSEGERSFSWLGNQLKTWQRASTGQERLNSLDLLYGEHELAALLSYDNSIVKCEKKYHLEQHKNTAIHMKNSGKKTGSQPFFPKVNNTDKTQEQFSADLCSAMVAANIPWKKLENPDFNAFLNKYTNMKIPDESTLRKHYLHSTYLSVVQTFDEEQAVAITEENAAISCSSVSADLTNVKSNFGNLPGSITALEARDLPLVKAVKIMRGIEENLNQASGSVGTAIVDKFNRCSYLTANSKGLLFEKRKLAFISRQRGPNDLVQCICDSQTLLSPNPKHRAVNRGLLFSNSMQGGTCAKS
uniref:Uncharacterized protein n=1 Tax=Timema monikensis TaxID=170555 RepID=A0A7R9EBL4_9NEOP|nr:unnamed protein product [Timema monikensis]